MQDPGVTSTRWSMHGWGDTSLLKQDGYAGTIHPRGIQTVQEGKASVAIPARENGRRDLYGVLSGTEAGSLDCWMGNPGIDPRKVRCVLRVVCTDLCLCVCVYWLLVLVCVFVTLIQCQ